MASKIIYAAALTGLSLMGSAAAFGHAFPQHEEPAVGSVVHESPKQVRIWFDAKLEPVFSSLIIKDGTGKPISGESRVDSESQKQLEAKLPPLTPGQYHVYWKVVAWDGHHSEGDYIFTFSP